jgi:hypothetical protein
MEEKMFTQNPWTDPVDDWDDEGDRIDRAYDELKDRRLEEEYGNTMRVTHGHSAEEIEYV